MAPGSSSSSSSVMRRLVVPLLGLAALRSASGFGVLPARPAAASAAATASYHRLHHRRGGHRVVVARADKGGEPGGPEDGADDAAAAESEAIKRFREQLIKSSEDGGEIKMSSTSAFATAAVEDEFWAKPMSAKDGVTVGMTLLGNPQVFGSKGAESTILNKVGLKMPIPGSRELDPDSRANLMPVIIVTSGSESEGYTGLMLNRRTGYLMGDLEQDVSGFMIQPLNFGGTQPPADLSFLHPYPEIGGSTQLGEDGLYYSGNFADAQMLVEKGTCSQFKFRFFIQCVQWAPDELEKQLAKNTWCPAQVSKDVILKIREREGSRRPKPLWTDVMDLAGGNYGELSEEFYA